MARMDSVRMRFCRGAAGWFKSPCVFLLFACLWSALRLILVGNELSESDMLELRCGEENLVA